MKNTVTQERIASLLATSEVRVTTMLDKVTVVSVKLPNGFVITESSACVDPKNYNEEVGRDICLERIENKLWELEGYLLSQKLFEAKEAPRPAISDDPIPEILDKLPKSIAEFIVFVSNAARFAKDTKYTPDKRTAQCTVDSFILYAEVQNIITVKESALLRRELLGTKE